METRPLNVHRAFVQHLAELAGFKDGERRPSAASRRALAALRRGLGKAPGTVASMYPYVERFLPSNPGPARFRAYYLVASLFASHPMPWRSGGGERERHDFGASMARLRHAVGPRGGDQAVDRRFVALLAASSNDAPYHLRQCTSLLATHQIGVDWEQLVEDLIRWDREDHPVQRKWANSMWGTTAREALADSTASDTEPMTDEI